MPNASPIQHVVIIVKENHTFDNYFGTFPGADGDATLAAASDPPPSDPPHTHEAWLQRDRGAVREQYGEANIPAYFAYARQFTLCDSYFTDVASQSEPNHLFLIAAASPIIDNATAHRASYQPNQPFDLPSLPASLEAAGLTWRNYGGFYHQHITALQGSPNNVQSDQFDADIDANNLPSVSWLYAGESKGASDLSEHPTGSVYNGMLWTVARVNKLARSGYWRNTVIFITWDDWGGWYDHVTPPDAEQWTGGGPKGYTGSQFRYGSRVPCLVISPYAKPTYISHTFHSHVSVVRFCEQTFGLRTLGTYDAAADDMTDCFDFGQQPLAAPSWQAPS